MRGFPSVPHTSLLLMHIFACVHAFILWICLFLCVLHGVHHRVGRADAKGQLPLDPVVAAADPSRLGPGTLQLFQLRGCRMLLAKS